MYVFGFIVAAVVGCTAGSVDLTEGMFRHLVITGRSRLALYFARIPAGLAIVIAMVAVGYTIVCAVCVFAAPAQLNYDGVNVPQGLSRPGPGQLGGVARRRGHLRLQLQRGPRAERPAAERPLRRRSDRAVPRRAGAIQTKAGGTITVPAQRIAGPDSGVRGLGRQPGLRRLHAQLHGPLHHR